MMNIRRFLSTVLLLIIIVSGNAFAQQDSSGTYCNVFYITSYNLEVLPMNDDCFIADVYSIEDPSHIRTLGPIEGQVDLFKFYPWAMSFYLPEIGEAEQLKVAVPEDMFSEKHKMNKGEFFMTITDNRDGNRFAAVPHTVDFVAVSGKAKVTEFTPMSGDMKYSEFKLQLDVKLQHVNRNSEKAFLDGDLVRLRLVLVVEPMKG